MQISYLPQRGRNRETREPQALVFPQASLEAQGQCGGKRMRAALTFLLNSGQHLWCVAYQTRPAIRAPSYQATGQASHQLKALVFLPVTHS